MGFAYGDESELDGYEKGIDENQYRDGQQREQIQESHR